MTEHGEQTRKHMLSIIEKNPTITQATLAWMTGTSRTNMAFHLDKLMDDGRLTLGQCSECGSEKWVVHE